MRVAERYPVGRDTIKLTDRSENLRGLTEMLAHVPVVNAALVEETRVALDTGRYCIDPARLADKLLQFEYMLYGNLR
jgi:flagellar biosynthesis anti-sigma factor FlgM